MKLDVTQMRYLRADEWRVLEALEIGHKNHELVPVPLIAKIAGLKRSDVTATIKLLLRGKFLAHENFSYDGYKLTYLGLDFLALRAFRNRGLVASVGARIGVGKESDIHLCLRPLPEGVGPEEAGPAEVDSSDVSSHVVLKLHRLGRISFRSIKRNRDYLGSRNRASWQYLSRLAAAKEFAFMKALYDAGFPVPTPVDVNRHAILMDLVPGYTLSEVRVLGDPHYVLEQLMSLIVRLAEHGVIHGDFNEFNIMIDDDMKVTLIDFPQMVSVHHPQAQMYFERDVNCIRVLFERRFKIVVTEYPKFEDVKDRAAAGFVRIPLMNKLEEQELLQAIMDRKGEVADSDGEMELRHTEPNNSTSSDEEADSSDDSDSSDANSIDIPKKPKSLNTAYPAAFPTGDKQCDVRV